MKRIRRYGDEQNAFSRFGKRYLRWRPGQRKRVKRRANRREHRSSRRVYLDTNSLDDLQAGGDECIARNASRAA